MNVRPSNGAELPGDGMAFILRVRPFLSRHVVELTVSDQDEYVRYRAIGSFEAGMSLCKRTADLINETNPSIMVIVDIDPRLTGGV
jgi:hypothetical protein